MGVMNSKYSEEKYGILWGYDIVDDKAVKVCPLMAAKGYFGKLSTHIKVPVMLGGKLVTNISADKIVADSAPGFYPEDFKDYSYDENPISITFPQSVTFGWNFFTFFHSCLVENVYLKYSHFWPDDGSLMFTDRAYEEFNNMLHYSARAGVTINIYTTFDNSTTKTDVNKFPGDWIEFPGERGDTVGVRMIYHVPVKLHAGKNGGTIENQTMWAPGGVMSNIDNYIPTPPEGYVFDGWYDDEIYRQTKFNKTSSTDLLITIYAHYRKDVTILCNKNGATAIGASSFIVTVWNQSTLGREVTLPTITRSGFIIDGWATTADSQFANVGKAGERISFETSRIKTIYAITHKDVSITTNLNGGNGTPTVDTSTIWNMETDINVTITAPDPTRVGYKFLGWSTDSNAKKPDVSKTYLLTNNIVVYAIWEQLLDVKIKVSGSYHKGTAAFIKVGGVWKKAASIFIKIGDMWKRSE